MDFNDSINNQNTFIMEDMNYDDDYGSLELKST